jgi:hypothetical protein
MEFDQPSISALREARAQDNPWDTGEPGLAPFKSRSHARIYAREHAMIKRVPGSTSPTRCR